MYFWPNTSCNNVMGAPNITKASLTIDGIYFVMDPKLAKQNVYNPKLGIDSLVITSNSHQTTCQRAHWLSWTWLGKCYWLYRWKVHIEESCINELKTWHIKEININNDYWCPPNLCSQIIHNQNNWQNIT